MSFFDTTPVGRLVNRFSKGTQSTSSSGCSVVCVANTFVHRHQDMYIIDEELVMTLRSYLWTLMSVVSTIAVISGVTPIFTLCLVPIIAFYAMHQNFFTVRGWHSMKANHPAVFLTVCSSPKYTLPVGY